MPFEAAPHDPIPQYPEIAAAATNHRIHGCGRGPSRAEARAQAAQADARERGEAGEQGGHRGRALRGQARRHRCRRHRQARVRRAGKSVARGPTQGNEAMKLPKYLQAWVDARDGRAYYYLRRRGFPNVRLRGLPWSPTFMAAYEAALAGPHTAIGAGRIKPGSVAAVVAEYLDSRTFFGSKSAGTQRMRRGILERFRAAYGERPMALLPAEWIEALLDSKPPHAARSWRATLRSLCQFALKRRYLPADPTANIKLRATKGDGFHTLT